ncbi:MAG: prolyl-tRNA synthetase associated domain-containing protein [Acetobacterium sp.]|uniref:prolyl-tRNA synthetase associated domain-containing protein n=1 Tax=Acetobacterium sp. TaxID=1872094 RepID=UPI00324293AB
MFVDKQAVLELLDDAKISYQWVEHEAVYTIDEMKKLNLPDADCIAKNLFVRDDKKQHFYLVSVQEEKPIDLKKLREIIGSRRLSFASEKDLQEIIGLEKGSVTPFGVLNDKNKRVKVFIDERYNNRTIAIHPNENTMTLWLKTEALIELLRDHGRSVETIKLG